jgi:hypothetical protein
MLQPVLVRANYKVTTSTLLTLEAMAGSNLPLLFPELWVFNRTPTTNNVTVSGQRKVLFISQPDPDFNGMVSYQTFPTFTLANNTQVKVSGLDYELLSSNYGQTTEITLANAGPAVEAWISVILKGMIDSSVRPDPGLVINV